MSLFALFLIDIRLLFGYNQVKLILTLGLFMLKTKMLLTSLVVFTLATSCSQQVSEIPMAEQSDSSVISSSNIPVPYKDKISPAMLKIIAAPDPVRDANNPEIKASEMQADYVDHFKFFTALDIGGSGIEEVLAHDGYTNASKYLVYWRDLLGENLDWPDHHSTTYKGPFPAMEHGLLKGTKGWFGLSNANEKADEYFTLAIEAWHRGLPATAPEQKEAWEWLGRASHFIQDVTVPHHTFSLARLDQLSHSPFEKAVSVNFSKYFPSQNYDGGTWNGKGPYPKNEQWGIYFDSRMPGNVIKNNATISHGLFKIANHKEDETNGNWDKVRSLVIPLATKTCAGVIVSFLQQVGEKP